MEDLLVPSDSCARTLMTSYGEGDSSLFQSAHNSLSASCPDLYEAHSLSSSASSLPTNTVLSSSLPNALQTENVFLPWTRDKKVSICECVILLPLLISSKAYRVFMWKPSVLYALQFPLNHEIFNNKNFHFMYSEVKSEKLKFRHFLKNLTELNCCLRHFLHFLR